MASMLGVRPLATGDIPAVAQLFSRVYPGKRWTSPAGCETYLATEGARAVGFIGVMQRPMRLRGRALERKKVPLAA